MTKQTQSTGLSACHKAEMTVVGSGGGTMYYECNSCHSPCDMWSSDHIADIGKKVDRSAIENDRMVDRPQETTKQMEDMKPFSGLPKNGLMEDWEKEWEEMIEDHWHCRVFI